MSRIPKEICAYCKGVKKLCGARVCPILVKQTTLIGGISNIVGRKDIEGFSPPNILVGDYGFPTVNVGPISAMNISYAKEDPESWARKRIDLIDILKMRLNMLYASRKIKVSKHSEFINELKEMIISLRPVDVDLYLKKEPRVLVKFDADIPPIGASGVLERVEIAGNPVTTRKVEQAITEDVKASIIIPELWKHGLSFYYIQRLLSAGLLGVKNRRRIVPTRWSITATDTLLSKYFLDKIERKSPMGEAALYHWEYLGNKYYIILIPSNYWMMEMFEIWLPFSVWVRASSKPVVIHIYEHYDGKPNKMDGGYMAIKYGILEYLNSLNRMAAAIAIRIITPRYFAPVGSWQIRESTKLALRYGLLMRGEVEELLSFVLQREISDIKLDLLDKSQVLKRMRQPTLDKFIKKY